MVLGKEISWANKEAIMDSNFSLKNTPNNQSINLSLYFPFCHQLFGQRTMLLTKSLVTKLLTADHEAKSVPKSKRERSGLTLSQSNPLKQAGSRHRHRHSLSGQRSQILFTSLFVIVVFSALEAQFATIFTTQPSQLWL